MHLKRNKVLHNATLSAKFINYTKFDSSLLIDNCLISDVDIRYSQNLLDDITLDPDWDLYQQSTDSSLCSSNSGGSGGKIFFRNEATGEFVVYLVQFKALVKII